MNYYAHCKNFTQGNIHPGSNRFILLFLPSLSAGKPKTGRIQNSFLNNCFNLKEYGSYHILVHVHVFHFLCEFKTGKNCSPNQNRPRKKKTQYTVNIGLNFEGVRQRYCKNTYR